MIDPFLVVGLGNPGREYRETRHNVGFMAVDRLAILLQARFLRLQSKSLVTSCRYEEQKIILAKPQTFMNLSGQAVQGLLKFHKIPINNLLVVHDDLDLPLGMIRMRPDGGSAGQRGMESILAQLGTDEFARLRLGIGRPPGQMQPQDYVLQSFDDTEMMTISETLERAVKAILTWVLEGIDTAMNKFNNRDL